MKQFLRWPRGRSKTPFLICLVLFISCISSCRKSDKIFPSELAPSFYSSDVLDEWFTLEIRLYKNATGIGNGAISRPFAYAGIAAYESIDPGYASWEHKYNGLNDDLPATDRFKKYHWPSSVNATLAEFNRKFFTTATSTAADLAAIDSLENAISVTFSGLPSELTGRSVAFGKAIADAIFAWSQTDGYTANNALAYTPPTGPGLWIPTPPALAKASGPYWGNDRTIIAGSGDNSQPGPPAEYSEDPNSDFYHMVLDLYKASKILTTEQKNMALFWRDAPGLTTPGHWMSIVQQVIRQTHSHLDKAAMTYALVGICLNDAVISVFKTKYIYNLVRPVSYLTSNYIKTIIGDTSWSSFIATPAHPEYSSAHAVVSKAAADALEAVYGHIGMITDHSYDYLGFSARSFNSFPDIALDAANSRFYGGIHYQPTIEVGLRQGKIVAENILNNLSVNPELKK